MHSPASRRNSVSLADVESSGGHVEQLKRAAATPGSVPTSEVLRSLVALEKQRIEPDQWLDTLTRHKWTVVYTASSKEVTAAVKGLAGKSGGYFPIVTCQVIDPKESTFENGVFIPTLAHITFKGPCLLRGRQLTFDVQTMSLGVGPWRWSLEINKAARPIDTIPPEKARKLPFFLYSYVDDDILVARGRSGWLALYARVDSEWQMSKGVAAVYR
ncbi:MAG: hypothetical protein WDW36_007317 [Sanguina aurantia]